MVFRREDRQSYTRTACLCIGPWVSASLVVARAGEFEQLFGHLTSSQNATPLHSHYLVMRWDFSVVDP